jgi:hypothetical protein
LKNGPFELILACMTNAKASFQILAADAPVPGPSGEPASSAAGMSDGRHRTFWSDFAAAPSAETIEAALASGEISLDVLLDAALASLDRSCAMLEEDSRQFALWRRETEERWRAIDEKQDRIDRVLRDLTA